MSKSSIVMGVLVIGLMACLPAHSPEHGGLASDLAFKTVALVEPDNPDIVNRPYCSGVWVARHEILTAGHCVSEEEIGAPLAYFVEEDILGETDPTTAVAHPAVLLAVDPNHDLALIYAGNPPPHGVAEVSKRRLSQGLPVYTMGCPLGLFWSYSSGEVSALRFLVDHDPPMWFVQSTAPISPGNSGGALFDDDGRIVGIVEATYTHGELLNIFVHRQYVETFLGRWI